MSDWIKKYWTQIVFVGTFIAAITTTNIQVRENTADIRKLETKQNSSEIILNDIRVELSAINTKLELLLEGKVIVENGK